MFVFSPPPPNSTMGHLMGAIKLLVVAEMSPSITSTEMFALRQYWKDISVQ